MRPTRLDLGLAILIPFEKPADQLRADKTSIRSRRDHPAFHAVSAVFGFEDHVDGHEGSKPSLEKRIDADTDGAIGFGLEEVHGQDMARAQSPASVGLSRKLARKYHWRKSGGRAWWSVEIPAVYART